MESSADELYLWTYFGSWKVGESLRVRELNVRSFCYFYFNMCSNCSREYYFVLVYVCFFCTKVVFLF